MASTTLRGRAEDLLARVPLVDGHNDLPWALRELVAQPHIGEKSTAGDGSSGARQVDLRVLQPALQTDFLRSRQGRLGMQFWSVWVPCSLAGDAAVTAVLEQAELVRELCARYPDVLGFATTADEAWEVFRSGRTASLLGAEGGHSINSSLGALRALRRLGVRYMTLTHNENTPWADSATDTPEHGGLTPFGVEVVREMNRVGMIVDLSHVAETTMNAALDASSLPVLFTHSSCRAVADHPRNVPDAVLERLAGNGGVCMVTFVPSFVSPAHVAWDRQLKEAMAAAGLSHNDMRERERFARKWEVEPPTATLDDVVAHVEHAREVAGIDHIGLGGDYDGVPSQPEGLEDVSSYPNLIGALLERGWSEDDCAKLAGGNALRVLRDNDDVKEG
ncbi:dipeptidase [Actinosynnema sp. NPDC047251]|uniref:Membrane dipeptidase n=1 Tax=Saccharothrix espanaensis (strain ATCC 51144 / DSM 44229 / JCM 9112 / NBRC 15066 / NRRL 15764) TaxID=1179773 RepID=K0JPU9_SACES|nr:dipeptidase [Saccharothrix espanaensis]CCH29180.1 membrane dipeptidase [Saccharothrix espanaensis DSM 44229]